MVKIDILYHFDMFVRHASQGSWMWTKSVSCPGSQPKRLTKERSQHVTLRKKSIFGTPPSVAGRIFGTRPRSQWT
jgi:hypothetical protein